MSVIVRYLAKQTVKMYSYALIFIIYFASISDPVLATQEDLLHWKRYSDHATAHRTGERLLNLTKTTYFDASQRISTVNNIRFMHEKTPFYEQGYVFSEIIERYKKMVEHYRKMVLMPSIYAYSSFDRVEHLQKLYFEIDHLVAMLHEIPHKYASFGGQFKNIVKKMLDTNLEQKDKEALAKAERERAMAAQMMMMAKKQADKKRPGAASAAVLGSQAKELLAKSPSELGSMFPKRWPHDYGWEPIHWN